MSLRFQLDRSAQFDAEYGDRLSSHLPMTLTALARLGASDARLAAFADHCIHAKRLHAMPAMERWQAGDPWQDHLGDPRAWPAYRGLFREWIEQEGVAVVLEVALPVLMRGAGAAAFHGLIRTSYAVTAKHLNELADALAYWAARWFTVGDGADEGSEPSVAVVLSAMNPCLAKQPLIAERMLHASRQPGFAQASARLRIDGESTLAQVATLAAHTYAATGHFTLLHLLTSAHAMRVLLPWLDIEARDAALRHHWIHGAAAFASTGLLLNAMSPPPQTPLPWKSIVAKALASNDDHVVKVVDSCREQHAFYGGDVWRRAAAVGVRRC